MNTKRKARRTKNEKRTIATEKHYVQDPTTGAKSSYNALFFHDIPPELIRRIAQRFTEGHKKYGVGIYNLNWRTGLDNPEYVANRFNHLWGHLLNFLADGNDKDDNLAAIGWCVGFLMEVERLYPEILRQVIGQCNYSGVKARDYVRQHSESR